MSVTTDKFPDGMEFNVSATLCDGDTHVPQRIVGGFNEVASQPNGGVPDPQYWGTFEGTLGKDNALTLKFEGHLAKP